MTDDEREITDEEIDAQIAHYVDIGVLEFTGMDESGEAIYRVTEVAEFLAPELVAAMKAEQMEEIDSTLMELVEDGLVEFEYSDVSLEPRFRLTERGKQYAEEILDRQGGETDTGLL